ncbi:MAG: 4Fe-4S dicluster domain-containing protein [Fibrobacter sp.]|nr:4Fe-4S dicluster domain-containing protein [Fibrobacter sp.]
MDRRDFIKSCSLMAVAGLLFGCRKIVPDGLETASDAGLAGPGIKAFEDEVRLAMSHTRGPMDLVRVNAPGKTTSATSDNRFGMAIDLDACDGCGKCILACIKENNIPLVSDEEASRGRFMHWIEMRGGIPMMCAHCGEAPCEKVCPTGAANHTPDGISAMMYKRCTGSRFCGANCPVKARKFNFNDAQKLGLARRFNKGVPLREKGVMEKCSLCLHRLQDDRLRFKTESFGEWRGRGVKTACAEGCPRNAIVFGNWLDSESPLVKATSGRQLYAPRELAGLDPSVVFLMGKR